ncbi:hypothetical protein QFZ58_006827 [Streptomyces sp. B1I3]|nr:hypothetical protein [Streptomyces sp. B1I3]MDQ0798339.1 hypothetical protein [Streptomyces sp. B1I3]
MHQVPGADGRLGDVRPDLVVVPAHETSAHTTLPGPSLGTARGDAWLPAVMEVAGIDQRLIGWQSTGRQQIEDALSVLVADYEGKHGHLPGERAGYALGCKAADRTRPPKRKELRSLSELRMGDGRSRRSPRSAPTSSPGWRSGRGAAATAVWPRVRPVVDVALIAVDVVAVVYVMRGAFKHHHLLGEARRHLSYVLRGRPHEPGLDEQIVQTVIDDYTRPASRGRMMTADLRALYPRDTDDQAVLRPLTLAALEVRRPEVGDAGAEP